MVRNSEFSDNQKDFLKDFLTDTKLGINKKRISPSYLLYIISKFPDSNKQDIYTKIKQSIIKRYASKKKKTIYRFYN